MLDKFEEYLNINIKSENTKRAYFGNVKRFYDFSDGILTQDTLNKYFVKLREENKSSNTFNLICNALRCYTKFMKVNLDFPKYDKPNLADKRYFTSQELKEQILRYLPVVSINYNRDDLILNIMFYAGLRPEELINLEKKDLDFAREVIYVKNTKGKVDREIPFLSLELQERLKKYVESLPDGKVFDINYISLYRIFESLKNELQLDFNFSPKTMRISFSKYCIFEKNIKGDIVTVSKLMGHKDINTTMVYVSPDKKDVIEACKKIKI